MMEHHGVMPICMLYQIISYIEQACLSLYWPAFLAYLYASSREPEFGMMLLK